MSQRLLAVCLHDVEHATLDRCRFIREWLRNRGVDRLTLLAIPCGRDGPLVPGEPCADWLHEATAAGDAVAQHGMNHRRTERAGRVRDWLADHQGGAAAEFVGLDPAQTVDTLSRGRALLSAAGVETRGFVAPAYAYTAALRCELRRQFDWYSGLLAIHAHRPLRVPAHGLGTSTSFKRRTSPVAIRAATRFPKRVLRLDIHPADFELASHVAALDSVLRARPRQSVTYDDLVD